MIYQIELKNKAGIFDAVGEGIKKDIRDLGITVVREVRFDQVYIIEGNVSRLEVQRVCDELLVDKITQDYLILELTGQYAGLTPGKNKLKKDDESIVEVAYNPGVMDPVEESVLKGIRDLGVKGVASIKTAKKYLIKGKIAQAQLKVISEKLLYNKIIQHVVDPQAKDNPLSSPAEINYFFKQVIVKLLNASDQELLRISKQGQLYLNLAEMKSIQKYFHKLKREPTDCELETVAQTWSEHCMHKTFRGKIEYQEKLLDSRGGGKAQTTIIDNLLKSTIMKVTKELNKPWCVSVFKDNAGIIKFDEKNNVCFKVETHNHPSALEPFGGANTGLGGVIRDVLGTGLGAKPIANTDVFCFAPPEQPVAKVPQGCLHPKRVMKGVVSGVRDYGNKMGIPTVNGAILFDQGFIGNPLVYCGTVGIMPKNKSFKKTQEGDFIVLVGGKTGRDGIHGATFSSGELTHESDQISSGAVQIGNPIQEKKVLDALLQARDLDLYTAITDCGAGGLSSAVGEMGQEIGARVYLERVPLKYKGLTYTEIWISESQERMVLSVSKDNIAKLLEVFNRENVDATIIGEFIASKRLKLYYKDNLVCDLDMGFLHDGIPRDEKKAQYFQVKYPEPKFACPKDLSSDLKGLLSDYDIASKEWVIRQYDHEVQGGSVIKPLAGINNDGPSDAALVKPILDSSKGLIISNGINFQFGLIDPYWMAASCIDEALRQIVAVGGSLNQAALLDNFCWGNPDKPDRLGSLVRASYGCYDMAKGFGVPFISGKDSLNNEYTIKDKSIAIPGTLLISAISVIEDTDKSVSMYAKQEGDLVYIIGQTFNELGGSHYFKLKGAIGNNCPKVSPIQAKKTFAALNKASNSGLIRAMHDCSEGGLAVAAAEMAFSGGLGMEISLANVPYAALEEQTGVNSPGKRNDYILFSESNSRFLVEVERKNRKSFESLLKDVSFGLIGAILPKKYFQVIGLDGAICLKTDIDELKEAWQSPLRW